MGMRFHKSAKIVKGVKVNFSKSGASLSIGGKGYSVNYGKKGTRVTAGIPGTGLSYIKKSSSNTNSHSKSSPRSSQSSSSLPDQVEIKMDAWGNLTIEDERGAEITDKAIIRKIQSLPGYKAHLAQLEELHKIEVDSKIQEAAAENERLINVYALAPAVESINAFEERYEMLKPEEYEQQAFDDPMPSQDSIKLELKKEADTVVKGFFLSVGKARKQYVEERFPSRYDEAVSNWEAKKRAYFTRQEEEKRLFDLAATKECEEKKAYLRKLIDGSSPVVEEVFDSWIESCELPVEVCIDYDWDAAQKVILLDVDLPGIDYLPLTKLAKTENGNLKEKKKTQSELRNEYVKLVFGFAIVLSANVFNISPAIQKIVFSGYVQREDREGIVGNDYIYSLKFPRSMFEHTDFATIDPKNFCLMTDHRCNLTVSSLFKAIVPFDSFD